MPGEGPVDARVFLVGAAPGAQEDRSGRPLCARAGGMLDDLLAEAGLLRSEIFVTSSVKCCPPRNRTPRADELDTCRQAWLLPQIAVVDPILIVPLGGHGHAPDAGRDAPAARSARPALPPNKRRLLPTCHPAAGMRFPRIGEWMRQEFARIARAADPAARDRAR